MENPNLLHAIAPGKVDIGTARECFAINSLAECHRVEYGKTQGDFKVDGHVITNCSIKSTLVNLLFVFETVF